MKKLIILFSALVVLASCNITNSKQDTQMLQSKYQTVYKINEYNYVTFDSVHVYHATITGSGEIFSVIKIK